MGSETCKV